MAVSGNISCFPITITITSASVPLKLALFDLVSNWLLGMRNNLPILKISDILLQLVIFRCAVSSRTYGHLPFNNLSLKTYMYLVFSIFIMARQSPVDRAHHVRGFKSQTYHNL